MRVFSKKALGFRNFETNEILVVRPLEFAELPEWVKKDPLYAWAIQEGTLSVVTDNVVTPKTEVFDEPVVDEDKPKAKSTRGRGKK